MQTEKLIGVGAAGLAALGLGVAGSSLASADEAPTGNSSSTSSSTQSPDSQQGKQDSQDDKGQRQAPVDDGRELTADASSKAIAAAQAKETDATVRGVHLGRDGGYEVMMVRSDGTMVEVVLDDGFTVTDVEEGHGGPGGGRGGHGPEGQQGQQGQSGTTSPTPSASSTAS